MTASAANSVIESTETFGLPATTPHLIAKLRGMDPDLLDSIRATTKDAK
jgi:hypothetical protein